MKSFFLSFVATDRPGLVEKLSQAVTVAGGNWLESRMARLAEKFAGIALLDIPSEKETAFRQSLSAIENQGFTLILETTETKVDLVGSVFNMELLGPDHPGIVHEITQCLAQFSGSVEEHGDRSATGTYGR